MQIHVRVVVRTTSATDRPSTPSLYWMPKTGIQSYGLDELEAGPVARQVADEQEQRDDPGRERERRAPCGRVQRRRQDRDHERADERQERDDRQDRACRRRFISRLPTSSRYEPAITIRPMAMPERVVLDPAGLDPAQPAPGRRSCRRRWR